MLQLTEFIYYFLMKSLVFSIYSIMSSASSGGFTSFFPVRVPFISFS